MGDSDKFAEPIVLRIVATWQSYASLILKYNKIIQVCVQWEHKQTNTVRLEYVRRSLMCDVKVLLYYIMVLLYYVTALRQQGTLVQPVTWVQFLGYPVLYYLDALLYYFILSKPKKNKEGAQHPSFLLSLVFQLPVEPTILVFQHNFFIKDSYLTSCLVGGITCVKEVVEHFICLKVACNAFDNTSPTHCAQD